MALKKLFTSKLLEKNITPTPFSLVVNSKNFCSVLKIESDIAVGVFGKSMKKILFVSFTPVFIPNFSYQSSLLYSINGSLSENCPLMIKNYFLVLF